MPPIRHVTRLSVSALAVVCGACNKETPAAVHATVRDSAGISIVENPAPLGPDHLPWTIDTVPLIDLGRDDDPHQQFSGFLVPLRLGNGQIVVAVGGSSEIRFFTETGTWLRNVGRSGQGPGEFEALGWIGLGAGDTLRTYDWNQRRVSVFSPEGKFVQSFLLKSPDPARGVVPRASLAAGRILGSGTRAVMPGVPSGVLRDTAALVIYGEGGMTVDSFGSFPGSEALIEGNEKSVTVMELPFGKDLVVAITAGHDAMVLGSEDRPEVSLWTAEGRLTRIIRWQSAAMPVTDQDRASYLQLVKEAGSSGQEEFQRRIELMVQKAKLPAVKPAYAGVFAGPRGTLWVQNYTAPELDRPVPYQVFDSTGQWLSELTLPPRFTVTQLGDDFVLGSWKNEDDVDHVRMYRLRPRH